jgi:hypothetical protein
MRALYSLLSHLRMLYALVQGIVAFAQAGWAALTPMQVLTTGLVLCILLRMLVPSPCPARHGPAVLSDHLLNGLSAASVAALQVIGIAAFCTSCIRLLVPVC